MLIFDRRLNRSAAGQVSELGTDQRRRSHAVLLLQILPGSSRSSKEGRALRTETVICNTQDFGMGAESVRKLVSSGLLANRPTGACVRPKAQRLCQPRRGGSTRSPTALRFGDPRR